MHPDLLPHVTPIVLSALTSPEIALYATMALKDMSRDCAAGMKPYSEVILILILINIFLTLTTFTSFSGNYSGL